MPSSRECHHESSGASKQRHPRALACAHALLACRAQGSSTYRPELEPAQQSSAFARLPPEQQQALEQENQALVSELSSLNQASNSTDPPDAESARW